MAAWHTCVSAQDSTAGDRGERTDFTAEDVLQRGWDSLPVGVRTPLPGDTGPANHSELAD